ncbi:MAG: ATP phosphoribosyltransferase regulatory subunit [Firmicutes bacterium]|nr:ATP phosphoribosyltransferase regulatory subunit [Bacillota bacterium]
MFDLKYQIPQGVKDELPDYYSTKENIINSVKEVFKSYGYRHISTPTIEYYDVFSSINSTLIKEDIFKFIDSSGKILALRPDVTIPIARIVANNYKEETDLKLFYISKVFRMNGDKDNLDKEFSQAGIEYFGDETRDADGEVIAVGIKALKKINSNFQVEIGNALFFKGLIDELNLDDKTIEKIRVLIENKNFVELKKFIKKLKIKSEVKKVLIELPKLYGNFIDVIKKAKTLCLNEKMKRALIDLEKVYKRLLDYGYKEYISADLGLINHLDYYTGIVFKGYINNHGRIILTGGRYDKLTKEYGKDLPATGFALNIDELIKSIGGKKDMFKSKYKIDFSILYKNKNRKNVFSIADKLRDQGFIVETKPFKKSLKEYINYADDKNVKKLLVYKDDILKLIDIKKNMSTNIKTKDLFNFIRNSKVVSVH